MGKHPFIALLMLTPLFVIMASCGDLVGVDFGAAHLGDDASITGSDNGEGGVLVGEGGVACQPKSCSDLGMQCGTQNDGCGNALDCGSCKTGACNDGKCACIPKTCPELKAQCGKLDNGCGGILDCGTCANPGDACDAETNTCQCKPKTCADQGADCGTVPDGCGGTYDCKACPSGPTPYCSAGKCTATPCTPTTCMALGKNCGQISDGCGKVLDCGGCMTPQSCAGGGVANVCGCTAKTCAQLGANCGAPANGCGGTLSCGTCTAPQSCGGGSGGANVCGCTPTGSCPVGANCGTVPDGCGNNVACMPGCTLPNTCGGGGVALHCGCTPWTCDDYTCGNGLSNHCGGTINCGTCGGGGGGCFAAETPVLMADGSMRPIVDVHPGDMIMGYDEATHSIVPRKVDRLLTHPAEASADGIVLINGSIRATRNHPILSGGHAVRAEDLKVGDDVHIATLHDRLAQPTHESIQSVTIIRGGITTYDLKTIPAAGYIVGDKHVIALIKQ